MQSTTQSRYMIHIDQFHFDMPRKQEHVFSLHTPLGNVKQTNLMSSYKSAKPLFVPSMHNKWFSWVCNNMSCIGLIKKSIKQTKTLNFKEQYVHVISNSPCVSSSDGHSNFLAYVTLSYSFSSVSLISI